MICPDVNLLLYAVNRSFPRHAVAKAWWEGVLSATEPVGLVHVVILGFLRLSTHPNVFSRPLTIDEAVENVESWLEQPNVRWMAPAESHWSTLKLMLKEGAAAANLTTDGHIAAMAADYGMVVYSSDADFSRFPRIKVVNPLKVA